MKRQQQTIAILILGLSLILSGCGPSRKTSTPTKTPRPTAMPIPTSTTTPIPTVTPTFTPEPWYVWAFDSFCDRMGKPVPEAVEYIPGKLSTHYKIMESSNKPNAAWLHTYSEIGHEAETQLVVCEKLISDAPDYECTYTGGGVIEVHSAVWQVDVYVPRTGEVLLSTKVSASDKRDCIQTEFFGSDSSRHISILHPDIAKLLGEK